MSFFQYLSVTHSIPEFVFGIICIIALVFWVIDMFRGGDLALSVPEGAWGWFFGFFILIGIVYLLFLATDYKDTNTAKVEGYTIYIDGNESDLSLEEALDMSAKKTILPGKKVILCTTKTTSDASAEEEIWDKYFEKTKVQ